MKILWPTLLALLLAIAAPSAPAQPVADVEASWKDVQDVINAKYPDAEQLLAAIPGIMQTIADHVITFPDTPHRQAALAHIFAMARNSGKLEKALELYNAVGTEAGKDDDLWIPYFRGMTYGLLRKFEPMVSDFETVLSLDPPDGIRTTAINLRKEGLVGLGRMDEIRTICKEEEKLSDSNTDWWIANTLYGLEAWERALEHLTAFIETYPKHLSVSDARTKIANALLNLERIEDAFAATDAHLAVETNVEMKEHIYQFRINSAIDRDLRERAEPDLRKLIEIATFPEHKDFAIRLLVLLLERTVQETMLDGRSEDLASDLKRRIAEEKIPTIKTYLSSRLGDVEQLGSSPALLTLTDLSGKTITIGGSSELPTLLIFHSADHDIARYLQETDFDGALNVISIAATEKQSEAEELARSINNAWPVCWTDQPDALGRTATQVYHPNELPWLVLIGTDGTIRALGLNRESVESLLKEDNE